MVKYGGTLWCYARIIRKVEEEESSDKQKHRNLIFWALLCSTLLRTIKLSVNVNKFMETLEPFEWSVKEYIFNLNFNLENENYQTLLIFNFLLLQL